MIMFVWSPIPVYSLFLTNAANLKKSYNLKIRTLRREKSTAHTEMLRTKVKPSKSNGT